jgi:hypothetical protein
MTPFQRFYRNNAEYMRERTRQWSRANPERVRAKNRKFQARNPTYFRDYWHRRKLRIAWAKWAFACALSRRNRA